MSELLSIKECELTKTGMILKDDLDLESWKSIGSKLSQIEKCLGFWVGDWLNYGEKKYGDIQLIAEEVGIDYGTARNYQYVSRSVEMSRRRDNLSFSHHYEVSKLDPDKQEDISQRIIQSDDKT